MSKKLVKNFENIDLHNSQKLQAEFDKKQKKCKEIDKLFIKTYDDYAKGILTEERFKLLSNTYDNEQKSLKMSIETLKRELEVKNESERNIEDFTTIIEKCIGLKELNANIINTLIDKVIVYEKEVVDFKETQKIEIVYKFVGDI